MDRTYADREERAYELVLHKFDEMLTRQAKASGVHQRGIVIHDKRVVEKAYSGGEIRGGTSQAASAA